VGLGMPRSWGLPSDLGRLTSTVLRYLDSRHPSDPVSVNIAAHYFAAPDLRVEWDEVASLPHAPGRASQSNRGHMRITSNSELRAQFTSYYDWVQ